MRFWPGGQRDRNLRHRGAPGEVGAGCRGVHDAEEVNDAGSERNRGLGSWLPITPDNVKAGAAAPNDGCRAPKSPQVAILSEWWRRPEVPHIPILFARRSVVFYAISP